MENNKRVCALGGVSTQPAPAPVETRPIPFMQMTERQDSRNVPMSDGHIELTALKFK